MIETKTMKIQVQAVRPDGLAEEAVLQPMQEVDCHMVITDPDRSLRVRVTRVCEIEEQRSWIGRLEILASQDWRWTTRSRPRLIAEGASRGFVIRKQGRIRVRLALVAPEDEREERVRNVDILWLLP